MKNLKLYALLILIFLFSFASFAVAADAATPSDGSLFDLARPLYDAFAGGHYAYAAALVVVLMVAGVKRYFGEKIPWLHTDQGGAATALIAAGAGAMATALAAPGAHVTLGLLKSAALVGVGAAGGFAVLKHLAIEPLIKPLQKMLPPWAQPIFNIVLWIFDKPDAGAQQVAKAEAAGAAAVAAQPAQGVAAVTGAPAEVK